MKKKYILVVMMVITMSIFMLAGCTKTDTNEQEKSQLKENLQTTDNKDSLEKNQSEEHSTPTESPKEQESKGKEEIAIDYGYTVDDGDFSFADLEDYGFVFSSGAGAWSTEITVSEDGSFNGSYNDTNMAEGGEESPDGFINICNFTGKFTTPIQLNDYTYVLEVDWLEYEKEAGTEEVIDKVRYCYTDSYGIADDDTIRLYLPGTPIKELPEEYMNWIISSGVSQAEEGELPFYGLYNINQETGFWSIDYSFEEPDTPSIDERIASDESSEKEQYDRLEKEDITQAEMNDVAAQVYQLWDNELNWIWDELNATLDQKAMESLQIEQRKWVKEKEAAMKKAGAEVEGGSMQPLLEYQEGSEMTKKRVYELAKLLH